MSSLTVPPHSIEAERSVLGSILIDKDGIIQVASLLSPVDFYDPAHSIVYDAMLELFSRNRPIDAITVREIIDDKKELEKSVEMPLLLISWRVFLRVPIFSICTNRKK